MNTQFLENVKWKTNAVTYIYYLFVLLLIYLVMMSVVQSTQCSVMGYRVKNNWKGY